MYWQWFVFGADRVSEFISFNFCHNLQSGRYFKPFDNQVLLSDRCEIFLFLFYLVWLSVGFELASWLIDIYKFAKYKTQGLLAIWACWKTLWTDSKFTRFIGKIMIFKPMVLYGVRLLNWRLSVALKRDILWMKVITGNKQSMYLFLFRRKVIRPLGVIFSYWIRINDWSAKMYMDGFLLLLLILPKYIWNFLLF